MKFNNKYAIIGLIFLCLLLFIFLTENSKKTNLNDETTVRIGALLSLTGEASYYGLGSKNVINLAVDEINKAGGINGVPLEIIFEDGKCTLEGGLNAAKKLVLEDKLHVIIGGNCSGETLGAIPIITTNHVLLFSPTASGPMLTNISPYFFRIQPSDASQGKVLAEFVIISKKWNKVAFLVEQRDFPMGVFKTFEQTFTSLGGQVIKEEFPSTATSYRVYLTKLKAENPDALFLMTNTGISFEKMLKELDELNWHPPLLALDSVITDHALIKKLGDQVEGLIGAEFVVNTKNPKYQHLVQAYKEKYQQDLPFPSYSQNIYDTVYLIKDGISKVGNNSEKMALWLLRSVKNWPGASGNINFDSKGERIGAHSVKIIKKGNVVDIKQ